MSISGPRSCSTSFCSVAESSSIILAHPAIHAATHVMFENGLFVTIRFGTRSAFLFLFGGSGPMAVSQTGESRKK